MQLWVPQSSCSFIPYAQMTILAELQDHHRQIFNPELALSLLAISLPFSSLTIISIYSAGDYFTAPANLFGLGAVAFVVSCVLLKQKVRQSKVVVTPVRSRILEASTTSK